MGLTLVTAPPVRPIGLEEAKDHLKVETTADDALIDALIDVALDKAEAFLWRQLVTATWDETLDAFPAVIRPQKPPLQSVTSITYIDTAGAAQTLDAAKYKVDSVSEPGRIVPAFGETWPSTRAEINAVTVRFVAGYGPTGASVPKPILQAMRLTLGALYQCRGDAELPDSAEALLGPYKIWSF